MKRLHEYISDDKTLKATVWYSVPKQEFYVEHNNSGNIDVRFMTEEEAQDYADEYVDNSNDNEYGDDND